MGADMRLSLLPLAALLLASCAPAPQTAEKLEATPATITAFTEGPTADAAGNIYFTETINQRIMKFSAEGKLTVFRENSNSANGLLIDPDGHLVACEGASLKGPQFGGSPHAAEEMKPRVTRTNLQTGQVEVLTDNFEGQPFNGPNDVTHDAQKRLYFTDLPGGAVYRLDPDKKITRLLSRPEIQRPNGIAISPDDKTLYLVEANNQEGGARMIRAYDLSPAGTLSNMRVFHNFYPGRSADGLCMDTQANLYAVAGLHQRRGTSETLDTKPGVHVFNPAGQLLKFISLPEDTVTNCTFAGPEDKTLFVTAGKGLYRFQNDIAGSRR
jgi:gluconolactonase